MTESIHETLLDRMPEVARGTAAWTPEDLAHLGTCAECRAAWDLVQTTAGLGVDLERTFDAHATARAVSQRLRDLRASTRTFRRAMFGLVAAAAALALYVARPRAPLAGDGGTEVTIVAAGARFLPELDSLSTDELAAVAEQVDAPASQLEIIEGQPLLDLDTTQLERVLRSLEG